MTPVTIPVLSTVATLGLLLIHIPPEFGSNEVVELMQISEGPFKLTIGLPITVIGVPRVSGQPPEDIKENVDVPALNPVTTPISETDATNESLLVQTPFIEAFR